MPARSGAVCRSCGRHVNKKVNIKTKSLSRQEQITVIEDNKPDLPTTKKECKKCHNTTAYYWLIQTRSADEPPTQFFRCVKCGHTWREYK